MSDDERPDALGVQHLKHEIPKLPARGFVKALEGLVEDEKVRFLHKRSG